MQQNNSAKFTFLYLLSLVSLGFFAVSSGMVLFQIINKNIVDVVENYGMRYSIEALRFALSAMIVAAPIYFTSVWQINKNLANGELNNDSGIRKWLTYLILLVTSFVMIGWTIGIVNNFLNGELTFKFILKALTVLAISGGIFSYYLYDIKREESKDKKNTVITTYFYTTIVLVVIVFISGIFFVESPSEARDRRIDNEAISRMSSITSAIQQYYDENGSLPESLDTLDREITYLSADGLNNPLTKKQFDYKTVDQKKYELCTDFLRASLDEDMQNYSYAYPPADWRHEAGYVCIEQKVIDNMDGSVMPVK